MNPITLAFGPLVSIECRRAVGRGWLILVRTLAGLAILAVTLIVLWLCWISFYFNPHHQPYGELRWGLAVIEAMLVSIGLVLSPALVAGTLAGEKERGAMGLLLTTRLSSREVIAGRFAGKMTQMAMILLSSVPAVVLLAAMAGMHADVLVTLFALPVAVSLGGGGLAMAVSSVSRRGRDALLTVYLIDLICLLTPLGLSLGFSLGALDQLASLNPYASLDTLIWGERPGESWLSIGLWCGIGLLGLLVASWRLAPSCLSQLDGARIGRKRIRRGRVAPLDERPMLWKELYIERAGAMGGFSWWVGAALSTLLLGGALALAGTMAWDAYRGGDLAWFYWAQAMLNNAVGRSGPLIAWVIQWAVGLRAAVTIASERERGTWDAILTSPLEGREILIAKLWGSLHALRWLFAAAVAAWTLALALNALTSETYAGLVFGTLVVGGFMAAVGLRSSLTCATATRAMAVTIGVWLGALVAAHIIAGIIVAVVWIFVFVTMIDLFNVGAAGPSIAWINSVMKWVNLAVLNGSYLVAALILVAQMRLQFDRLAGRRAGGRVQAAADEILHGIPIGPAEKPPLPSDAELPLASGSDRL